MSLCALLCGLLCTLAPALAIAGAPRSLDERAVVELARKHGPGMAAIAQQVHSAEAAAVGVGRYPNPQLGWQREHQPGHGFEDALALTVPIDLSSQRASRRHLAATAVQLARSRAASQRGQGVLDALLRFYETMVAERRLAIAATQLERLDRAAEVLRQRHQEGTASGYELTRMELEGELARSALRTAEIARDGLRLALSLQLGIDGGETLQLVGPLAPTEAAQAEHEAEPSALREARAAERTADNAREAADATYVPRFSLSGGVRRVEENESQWGYQAGLSMELPLNRPAAPLRAQAKAARAQARAQAERLERTLLIERARAALLLSRTQAELQRFGSATRERVELLGRAVQQGYLEGRRTLIELLDAQRTRTAVAYRELELALAARQAELSLRAARGEFQ